MISEAYREQNRKLHDSDVSYGTSGHKYAGMLLQLATSIGAKELLDYGCGKQTLANSLPQLLVRGYDPAVPGLDNPPVPHDLVVCTDVLEHVEPEHLDAVLDDLSRVTRKALFLEVATRPARKTLEDGRNAHLTIEPCEWWLPRLWSRFTLQMVTNVKDKGFIAIFRAKEIADERV